ncbi:uncharacterized protein PHACADRAFT_199629 [Phanerochaete carnosa HHB-10118-sp]|uniref:Uncharacterized protein n=1 Tax=Phanerochaete carnosa (strain HHB-10118-sp) TaxID=650164 RepID=K5VZ68_PHACS|nr:uncharacterized protein PHACADRAFT_199629 [Phanerochaete carnosa HHB-10118-sp]EKM52135.1 hypothetical protein PHACADRAFT_199629 [Phanerochaete carnosa HHB-10118-sp]
MNTVYPKMMMQIALRRAPPMPPDFVHLSVSDLKPDAKPVAHREPPDSDTGAKNTSLSEAQAEADDHAPQILPVAIPSFAEEGAGGRRLESFLLKATGETDDDGEAVKDRAKNPGIGEPVAHELVSSNLPNLAGMRPSRNSPSPSRRDDSFDPTGRLRQDIDQLNASAARNSDEIPGILQNSPFYDLAIARSYRSADDQAAEVQRPNSSVFPGAAVLFQGVGGHAAEKFELALRQGAMSEEIGEQDRVEA